MARGGDFNIRESNRHLDQLCDAIYYLATNDDQALESENDNQVQALDSENKAGNMPKLDQQRQRITDRRREIEDYGVIGHIRQDLLNKEIDFLKQKYQYEWGGIKFNLLHIIAFTEDPNELKDALLKNANFCKQFEKLLKQKDGSEKDRKPEDVAKEFGTPPTRFQQLVDSIRSTLKARAAQNEAGVSPALGGLAPAATVRASEQKANPPTQPGSAVNLQGVLNVAPSPVPMHQQPKPVPDQGLPRPLLDSQQPGLVISQLNISQPGAPR